MGSGLRNGWEVRKLGEVCKISTGKSNAVDAIDDGKYAFFDRSKKIKKSDKFLFDCEAIIMAGEGQKFLPKFYSGKFDLHQRAYAIYSFNSTINIQYIFKYLIHIHKYFEEVAVGATVKSLRLRHFQDLTIVFPPLQEQEKIVAILDEAFLAIEKAKANAQTNLQNAKELFESYLQGVFENRGEGWEEKSLGEIAKHSLGKMLDKKKNTGILQKYLRNQSVRWFEFDLNSLTEMPFLESEKEKFTAIKGDVLICEGGHPGRAAIWKENYPIYFQKAIHRVRFHKQIYNKWFLYYLFILNATGKLKTNFTGATIQHFTGQSLDKLIVPIPPENEVIILIQKLNTLSLETKKLESIYTQKLSDLEELKKSLLQKAFNGELL